MLFLATMTAMVRRSGALAVALLAGLLAAACAGGDGGSGGGQAATTVPTTAPPTTLPDAAAVGANELGLVPVIMYHRLLPAGEGGDYDHSPEEFRAELRQLYDDGYRPVTAAAFGSGEMDLPAGTSPVVLTFDDATHHQFRLLPDGTVDPTTSVGILLDFAEAHPDFPAVASFYVNRQPFGIPNYEPLLQELDELGFEVANHTIDHVRLATKDATGVQQGLVEGQREIRAALPDAEVATMSLPLGSRPTDPALGVHGTWDGETYDHVAVFLVGAGPAPSPFHSDYDASGVPRMRSSTWDGGEANYGSSFWLDSLRNHPERRYVSDGVVERISFPAAAADGLDPAFADRANPY